MRSFSCFHSAEHLVAAEHWAAIDPSSVLGPCWASTTADFEGRTASFQTGTPRLHILYTTNAPAKRLRRPNRSFRLNGECFPSSNLPFCGAPCPVPPRPVLPCRAVPPVRARSVMRPLTLPCLGGGGDPACVSCFAAVGAHRQLPVRPRRHAEGVSQVSARERAKERPVSHQ